jgi:hypothetical protein
MNLIIDVEAFKHFCGRSLHIVMLRQYIFFYVLDSQVKRHCILAADTTQNTAVFWGES